ncbi:MAG TPA: hypothetical protein PLP17_04930 [Oligoflexia bacterium]|nr:hypothetical protein [Oligoflexia bacterium]
MKTAFLSLIFILCFSAPASAQIFECDGRWTNRPCSGKVEGMVEEVKPEQAPVEDSGLSEKKALYHDLNMKTIEAKRRYNLRFDLAAVQQLCFQQQSTLDECRKEIQAMEDRIDAKIGLASQERANELQNEANRLQQEKNETPSVSVVENNYIEVIPRRRHHPRVYTTGNYGSVSVEQHREEHGAGISVLAGGAASGSTIAVSGTAGGTVISTGEHPVRPRMPRQRGGSFHR